MTNIQYPIIIVGAQRSGTTLLRTMLDQHPDLLVHPAEPQFILEVYERFGDPVRDAGRAVRHIAEHPYLPETLERKRLVAACAQTAHVSLTRLIHCYLQVWGGTALQLRHPVLKYPHFVFHLDLIYRLFPDAHIVHIVRDPRASVSSQRARWTQFTIWECAMHWRSAVRAARNWKASGKTAYTEIRYEDLVESPEHEVKKLCQALDIRFSDHLLTFDQTENVYDSDGIARPTRFSAPDPARLSAWRGKLTPSDIELVEICCKREMPWWDYRPIDSAKPTDITIRLFQERLHYFYKTSGRRAKHLLRRAAWRLRSTASFVYG